MASRVAGHTELIDGTFYEVSPRTPRHVYQGQHAPEVDVASVRANWYAMTAEAGDTFAAIEVADTSFNDDRTVNNPLYEAAGIAASIVNIAQRRVELYAGSGEHRFYGEGEICDVLGIRMPVLELSAL